MPFLKVTQCELCGAETIDSVDREHNICRCERCGFVFDSPRPNPADVSDFYSRKMRVEVSSALPSTKLRANAIRLNRILKYKKSGELLDIGAGIGDFLSIARSRFRVFGTEVSDTGIEVARNLWGVFLKKGDPRLFCGQKFDVITLFHVLEHVHSPRQTILECHKLLKDDGVLILVVPNEITGIRPLMVRILKKFGVRPFTSYGQLGLPKLTLDGTLKEIHLSHFTESTLILLLHLNGFEVIENTLDPAYAAGGMQQLLYHVLYVVLSIVKRFTGMNFFIAMWITAKKRQLKPGS